MSEELEFLEMPDLTGVSDPEAVAPDEYGVTIVAVNFGKGAEGTFMQPRFKINNHPEAKTLTHYLLVFPDAGVKEERLLSTSRQLKHFMEWCGLPLEKGNLNKEMFIGISGDAILGQQGEEGVGYGIQNTIKKLIER